MQIITKCPVCGKNRMLDVDATDRRIRCQKCNILFKIPKLDELPKAAKIIKLAKANLYVDQEGKTYG